MRQKRVKQVLAGLLLCATYAAFADTQLPAPQQTTEATAPTQYNVTADEVPKPLSWGWDNDYIAKYVPGGINRNGIPKPQPSYHSSKKLSLQDAIYLSLRNNPTVISSELQRINDKFSLEIAANAYQPQFSFESTESMAYGEKGTLTNTPSSTLTTKMGTEFTLDKTSLQVSQPLLQGFGQGSLTYQEALNQEENNKYTFASSVAGVVSDVINSYRSLVTSVNQLKISEENYKQSIETTKQIELQYKAGRVSNSDLLDQQSTFASDKLSYKQDQLSLASAYQDFMKLLGLSPESKLTINSDIKMSFSKKDLPAENACIAIALKHNIDYQQELIALKDSQIALEQARDAMKWTLSVDATHDLAIADSLENDTAEVSLSIPINDISSKAALVSARIAYEMAKLNLQQDKAVLIRQIQQDYQDVVSNLEQVDLAAQSLALQKKAQEAKKLQLKYGKITVQSYNLGNTDYLSAQSSLVDARISCLNSLTTLNSDMGRLLDQWKIKLRY